MEDMLEEFKKLLREKGLKTTGQRLAVLKTLLDNPEKHMTVEEIYDIVRKSSPEIGLATVYRNIQLLTEMQLTNKLNLDDGYIRYELADPREHHHHHHHMICLDCGRVFEFQQDLLDDLEDNIMEKTGFKVVNHEVKFYGYCADCLARWEKEQAARAEKEKA